MSSFQRDDAIPQLPQRAADAHKGTFGRVLLIGGSVGMAGSISLSAMAALRSGAGLVTIAVPEAILSTVASFHPAYMTIPLACDDEGKLGADATSQLEMIVDKYDAVAIGPGLGRSETINEILKHVYSTFVEPIVIDADGLNALAEGGVTELSPAGPRVLTPHPGEFARLAGKSVGRQDEERVSAATELAEQTGAVIVLKGHHTVIAGGGKYAVNQTGNPGLATGGTGDVLTGMTAALLAGNASTEGDSARASVWEAARLAVHLHGLAGDLAAEKLGQVSLIATDVIDFLPTAFQSLQAGT